MLISNASAEFYVNFYSSYGIFGPDGVSGIIPNDGDTALIQLLYAGENDVIDDITDYNLSTGDDVVLDSFEYTNNGSAFAEYVEGVYGSVIAPYLGNGYIYGRVFSSLVPSLGDSYYVGSLVQAPDIDTSEIPPPLPFSYNLGNNQNDQVANLTLNFDSELTYILSVSSDSGGTVSPEGSSSFEGGAQAEITATADLGYLFSAWLNADGNAYSYSNPAVFSVTSDQTLIAKFTEDLSDEDEDGLSLYDEVITYGSDPTLADTSGDGLSDGLLVLMGLNPTVNFSNVISTVQAMPESFGVYGVAFVNELQASITNLTEVTIAQSNEIAVAQAMLTEVQAELTTTIEQNTALEAEVSGLTVANLALTDSVSVLTEENSGLTAQVGQLQVSNSQLTAVNQGLELSVTTLTTEKATLNEQVASLQTTNADLESQIVSLSTNANAVLLDEIATLESTNSVLTGLVAQLELEIDVLEGDVVELQLEVADLEEALEDAYVSYDKPDWIWDNWHYPWYKPNNYWWGWGNPPARYLPKWGREATVGKRVKMKRLKKRWNADRQEQLAELELELCVEAADDLVSGTWSATTNQVMIDIPVDDSDVKFYRINYN
jgi:hypothetical protein